MLSSAHPVVPTNWTGYCARWIIGMVKRLFPCVRHNVDHSVGFLRFANEKTLAQRDY